MSQTFPQIKPSEREFTLGTFPTKTYRALSGATVKRSFGNKPYGFQLRLIFANVKDEITSQLLSHYTVTSGGFVRFTLPSTVFAGMSATLRGQIQAPHNIRWEYASPPAVQSVFNGISTVTIDLNGEINV
jgi:hypothetical protein